MLVGQTETFVYNLFSPSLFTDSQIQKKKEVRNVYVTIVWNIKCKMSKSVIRKVWKLYMII